ncbi:hypothetical protein [Streptomyces sp. NBC_00203]|uniref:hypothetical protein n=1 Tax=Streptomyces sp. NBC_00203 TaxID=2975680 RepID=UPI00324846DC
MRDTWRLSLAAAMVAVTLPVAVQDASAADSRPAGARLGPLPLEGEQLRTARESAGGARDVAQDIGGAQGAAVLRAASDAFDSALTTTAYVSAALVAVAAVLTVALVPEDFKVTGTH